MHLTRRLSNLWVSLQGLSSCPRDLPNTRGLSCCVSTLVVLPPPGLSFLFALGCWWVGTKVMSMVTALCGSWDASPHPGVGVQRCGWAKQALLPSSHHQRMGKSGFSGWCLEELRQEKASLAPSASLEPGRDLFWMRHPVQQRGLEVGFL